ncbi:MAG: MGMT family protein [DPANN group archaeon]|nr:MGMT family protein [DPANN group archaeon]
MNFQEQVWQACSSIPRGKVSTYQEIARFLGGHAYRAVGQALRHNPHAPAVPCHRVVRSDGSLGGYQGMPENPQKGRFLRSEGICITDGKIQDFKNKVYRFPPALR